MLNGNKKYKKKMKLLRDSAQRTEHYKMYKVGRNWLFAGITILFFGAGISFGLPTANADTDLNSSSEVISASSAVNSSSGSSTEVTDVVAASASTATDSGSQKSSSGGATSTVASTSAITKESSTDSSQLTSAVASSTTNETISSASSLSGSSVTAQASSGKTLNSVASAGPSAVNSKNAVSGDLNSEVYTEASVANNSTSVSAVSTSSSVAKISKAAAPISSALTTLQTKLPAGSVVTTQTDGTVVIALAVGADETAVKALVDKANLNTQVVIEAKDANVVVPNLNDVANINKAGDKYTGTSSTVAQDFTAAGTATLPSGNGYSSLTTKTQNQSGYLVLDNQLNFSSDFSMSGTIYLGDNVSKAADGLTFVFSPGNPSSLGTASTGGNLGLGGLANSFGLALDEHYNSGAYGDFDNADAILGNPFLTAATISWRTTDSTGKLNPNTRQGQGNLLTGYGNVSAIDKTSQVVAMNNNMIDGKAHAFSISYNATTGVLTITIPDNDNQNQIYKPTGATSATVWTRTLTAAQKVGMSLSIAASTGDDFNAFGVQINNYSYTKATSTVTYKEIDSAGTTLPGTITHTIIGNIGDTIRVFADQASANAAITAGTATAALSVVAPKVPGYVLQNTVSSDFVVGSSNVSLIYNKQTAPVTVHYQDYAGNMISKDATLTGSYGDTKINGTTTTNPMVPTITGYTFSATDAKNAAATVINFTALDANGNMYVTDANGKAITAITLYYKVNATVTLSGTETEQYTGMQQTPKASNYKITLPTGVSYPLKDSDIQLVSGGKDVGTYALELSTVGVSNITAAIGNSYAISFNTATGSFVITAADTKVTLSGAETEQYTGAQQTPKASNYKITLPTGVSYSLRDSDIQLVSGGINTGTYSVVLSETGKTAAQAAITAATGTNYNPATFEVASGTTFVITKAPITATISSATKVYDGAATGTTATVVYTVISGSMIPPTISWASSDFEYLAADGQTVVTIPTTVGAYTVQFSAAGKTKLAASQVEGGTAQNYTVTPANGTYIITAATATVNLTGSQTVPFTGVIQSPTAGYYNVTLSNGTTYTLKAGDIALTSGSDGKNVGSYTVQLTKTGLTNITTALTSATGGNYTAVTLGKTTGTFIITPVSTTVTLSGTETEQYTGVQQSPSAGNYKITLLSGVTYALKDSDIQLVSGGTNSGTYEVTLSNTGKMAIQNAITSVTGSNYTVSFDSATAPFIIVSAKVAAELSKTNFDYDGTTKASGTTDLYVVIAVNDGSATTLKVPLSNEDVDFVTNGTNVNSYEFNLNTAGLKAANEALSKATNGNYQLAAASDVMTGSVTINKAKATISIISNDKITYDGNAHSLNIEVTGAVNGEKITYASVNNSHTTVGQYTVTAIADANVVNSNYEIAVKNGSMTIVKAPVTPGEITIGDANAEDLKKTYNGQTFSGSPIVQGPETDVTLTNDDYEYLDANGKIVTDPVNAGSYTIKLTQYGINAVTDANSDYDLGNLSNLTNNATIQKAQAKINITSNDNITYDGAAHSLDTEAIGAVNGETITYTVTNNSHTAVGQYDVSANADANAINSNYEITPGSGSMKIVKAPITPGEIIIGDANGNDLEKTYNGKTFDESPVVQGPEKDVTLSSGDYEYLDANGNVITDPVNAGDYTIKLTESGIKVVTDANRNFDLGELSSLTNNATIKKANANINIVSNDKITYDGAAHSLDVAVTGAVNGETIAYTVTNNSHTAVGQYDVAATADDDAINDNYNIMVTNGSMTIVKATIPEGQISIGDANGYDLSKTYDGKTFTENSAIVVQGPEKDVTLTNGEYAFYDEGGNEITDPVNAGNYMIKFTEAGIKAVTDENSGYELGDLSILTNNATINKAKASINITSNDKITYDGAAHSLDVAVTGAVNGETITYLVTNNIQTTVGQYDVAATADDNAVNSNYEITAGTGSMVIVKAPIAPGEITIGDVNGENLNKTYDGKTFDGSPVVQGPEKDVTLEIGDYEYLDANGVVVKDPKNAGNYTIKLTNAGIKAVTAVNSNYDLGDLSSLTNEATINKAKASINVASNDDITYDGTAHSLKIEVVGAANGETIIYTAENNSQTTVGQYDVTSTADKNAVNSNYEITAGTGSMTILKAPTMPGEIIIGDANGAELSKTYDGKTFSGNPELVVQGPENNVSLTPGEYAYYDKDGNKVNNPVNADHYTIKLTKAGIDAVTAANSNYDLGDLSSLTNNATINRAPANINIVSDDNIVYDGDAHSLDIEVTGAVDGETITYTPANNNHTTVGQYDVTATADDDNPVNSNYEITSEPGSMTIVKAPTTPGEITVGDANGEDLNKTYDGKTFSGNPVVQGPEKDVTLTTEEYAYYDKDGNKVLDPVNAGDYTIKLTDLGIQAVIDANSDYDLGNLTVLANKATIQKAKASINITSDDAITYDGTTHSSHMMVQHTAWILK
ncbi:MBG domain-containing protein [Pediococcus damnosus]|uniref:MBG domain-containing protein n=1 Tax=Pediococcus damnosus TaxID=51663 RepID=UPI003F6AAE4B